MKVVNVTRQEKVADRVLIAHHLFDRLRGLIGRTPLQKGEAFWIPRCQGIHTLGMGYPIDVIFLDSRKKVVRVAHRVAANSLGPVSLQAQSVVELPPGRLEECPVNIGDVLDFVDEGNAAQPATSSGNSFRSPSSCGK